MTDLSALVGAEVRRVQLDYQVTLLLVDGPYKTERVRAELILESPFAVTSDGQTFDVVPNTKDTHPAVCPLLHMKVTGAVVTKNVLTMTFDGAASLTIGPHPRYESWQLIGSGIPNVLVGPE